MCYEVTCHSNDFFYQVLNTASNSLQLGTNVISGSNVIPAKPSVLSPNVTQVLNKKVKIQPKPVAPVQTQTQAQLPAPSMCSTLIFKSYKVQDHFNLYART